jgi:site-specific DNA-methyltransferase (adenine-specific)
MSASDPIIRDVHEYVLIFSKESFRRSKMGVSTISNEEFCASTLSVWDIRPESPRRINHPTPFPEKLAERLIHLYTYTGDVVLDPFMGSGTSAVCALRSGRSFIGYEWLPEYVRVAESRIAKIHNGGGPRSQDLKNL